METISELIEVLEIAGEKFTMNAIARAIKEAYTPEKVNLLLEYLEEVRI